MLEFIMEFVSCLEFWLGYYLAVHENYLSIYGKDEKCAILNWLWQPSMKSKKASVNKNTFIFCKINRYFGTRAIMMSRETASISTAIYVASQKKAWKRGPIERDTHTIFFAYNSHVCSTFSPTEGEAFDYIWKVKELKELSRSSFVIVR